MGSHAFEPEVAAATENAPGREPVGVAPTAAQIVALQRTAGNAAVAALLQRSRSAPGSPQDGGPNSPGNDGNRVSMTPGSRMLQRRLVIGPAYLGSGGSGTYGKIKEQLEAYQWVPEAAAQLGLLQIMKRLIAKWNLKHAVNLSGRDAERKRKLDNLEQDIDIELRTMTPQAEYVKDLHAKRFAAASFTSVGEVKGVSELIQGHTGPASQGFGAEALEEARAHGVFTQAELLALKIYSVSDYQAINPAMEYEYLARTLPRDAEYAKKLTGIENWLKRGLGEMGLIKDPKDPTGIKTITAPKGPEPDDAQEKARWKAGHLAYDAEVQAFLARIPGGLTGVMKEGLRHAQFVEEALLRLPPYDSAKKGETYRGERWYWPVYQDRYGAQGNEVRTGMFLSTSKDPGRAKGFARKKEEDGKVGVLLICNVKRGRDVEKLSAHPNEAEVLLLPGARLRVDRPPTQTGSSDYDYVVHLTEV